MHVAAPPATLRPLALPQVSRWLPALVIALAQLMILLDTTIMIVALPSAQQALNMSDATRQWVVTAYTLAYGGLLLLGGRLADRLGQRRTLLIGILGFALASAVGGAAQDAVWLIGARATQGVFGAILGASTRSLLSATYPQDRERATAIGIFGAILTAGVALGFVLGGLLTSYLSWRWCLYVNLPIALVATVGALLVLPNPSGHSEISIDVTGAVLAFGAAATLVYALSEAASTGWHSPQVLLWLLTALVLLAAFVVLQARLRNPLLPLRLLMDRNRVGALLALAANPVGTFGMMLILTYTLQEVLHYSPLYAGLALLPFAVAAGFSSAWLAPRMMRRLPARYIVTSGLGLGATGLVVLGQLGWTGVSLPLIVGAQVLLGIGAGLNTTPALTTALSGVASNDTGITSALTSTTAQLSASIGTALLNTIAVTATAAYVTAHPSSAQGAAILAGYNMAAIAGSVVLVGAAVLVVKLINSAALSRGLARS
jgi:EmrB/QacA subfamily drug resistance transporter